MAQSLACMNVVTGGVKLEGLAAQGAANARVLNGKCSGVVVRRNAVVVASVSSHEEEEATPSSSRRSMLSLLAAAVVTGSIANQQASALTDIKLDTNKPPLSGGLPGTENADQARDGDLNLKERFFLQSVPTDVTVKRIKEAADEILAVKSLIDKKAWPYVQNALRSKAQYLGFDLKSIIDTKGKPEKKDLSALKNKLFEAMNKLDYAAREKSSPKAEKAYAEITSLLGTVVSKFA